jgi:formylmethanofuran:tetrahydromethanopterin formyltransferase
MVAAAAGAKAAATSAASMPAAAAQAQHPKLMVQIDDGRVAQAYDACVRFLNGVDRKARRRAMLAGMASSIAFSLFVVGVLFLAVLYWRGLV